MFLDGYLYSKLNYTGFNNLDKYKITRDYFKHQNLSCFSKTTVSRLQPLTVKESDELGSDGRSDEGLGQVSKPQLEQGSD